MTNSMRVTYLLNFRLFDSVKLDGGSRWQTADQDAFSSGRFAAAHFGELMGSA